MTNIETRLRRDLPSVAEALLAESTHPFGSQPNCETRQFGRLLVAAAIFTVALGAGFFVRAYTSPPLEFIETAAQASRVDGLDDEFRWMATDAMAPAIPADSHVRLFEVSDNVVLERGDIVVVQRTNPDFEVLRRIVGLPGETVEADEDWQLLSDGDRSSVTGSSDTSVTSDGVNFGYVVVADNPSFRDQGFERYAHDEIRLWAPADTSALGPLLPTERSEMEASLRTCLEEAGLEVTAIDFSTREVFGEVFGAVEAQGISEASFRAVTECTRLHGELSR